MRDVPHMNVKKRPVRSQALLNKERGVWVFQREQTNVSIPGLIDRERARRARHFLATTP